MGRRANRAIFISSVLVIGTVAASVAAMKCDIRSACSRGFVNSGGNTYFYDDNGNEVTVNQGRTMIFIIRDDRDDFDIDGITYYPEDHATITAPREDASDSSTEEESAPVEEPENEEM